MRLTADSLKAKTKAPALSQTKAKAFEDTALVTLQAAEVVACEAHVALTDAIHGNWAAWRRVILEAAHEQHEETRRLFAAARAAVEQRRLAYTAALALDAQVVARYPEDLPALKAGDPPGCSTL